MKKIFVVFCLLTVVLSVNAQNVKKFRQQFIGGTILIGTGIAFITYAETKPPPPSNPNYYKSMKIMGGIGCIVGVIGTASSFSWLKKEKYEVSLNPAEIKLTIKL